MPTYEFRCPDGTIIERFYKISEAPQEIPSPNGDGMAVRIISGGAGLLFKGSGFYITDYGKDGKKDQRAAAGESHPPPDGKSHSHSTGSASHSHTSGSESSAAPAATPSGTAASKSSESAGTSSAGTSSAGKSSAE